VIKNNKEAVSKIANHKVKAVNKDRNKIIKIANLKEKVAKNRKK
jgi:hypothetical protein